MLNDSDGSTDKSISESMTEIGEIPDEKDTALFYHGQLMQEKKSGKNNL